MTLLDGDFPWGAVIPGPFRGDAAQRRLVVYPPGITKADRRWLRVWRGFPLWGGVMWLVLQVILVQVLVAWPAALTALGVIALVGAVTAALAGQTRREVRTLNAGVLAKVGEPEVLEGQRRFRLLATTLLIAHSQHNRGELSAVDYELIWWRVYNAMPPGSYRRNP